MRILWLSNSPWSPTGYGNQTRLFVPRLKDAGHEMGIFAFYGLEGGIINWGGIPVYPRGGHPYGMDLMSAHFKNFQAQIMISLMDAWVFTPQNLQDGVKWVPWYPVDMEPLPPLVKRQITWAEKRLVFSKFGEKMTHDAGMDCYYVPHGVETNVFRPGNRIKAREILKWDQDKFIVGFVGANKGAPSRKAIPQLLEAYKEFRRKHDDTILYMHTNPTTSHAGVNINELVDYLELKEDVYFPDPYVNLIGFPDQHLAVLYNAFDVFLLPSMGEGFGIPLVEAQACGCPVITGDWTACGELVFSGWKIPKSEAEPFWTPLAAHQYLPRVGAIVDALEMAYRMRGNMDYRNRARDGALDYDADRVTSRYWLPVLEQIKEGLPEIKEPEENKVTA